MQKIIHSSEYRSVHPVFDEIEQFYALTSEKTLRGQNVLLKPVFDNAFSLLQSLFNSYGNNAYSFEFTEKNYQLLELPKYDPKNVIILFSGGKDSTATAVKYKEVGFNVYLFHMKYINKAYPDEHEHAKQIAEYLNLPIHFEEFKSAGKLGFPEHPMKNMILAVSAIQWGIMNGIGTKIVAGNYAIGTLNEPSFYINGDDMPEMWYAFDEIVRRAIDGYGTYIGLQDSEETMDILSKDTELIKLCQSCIGAHRFKKYNHDLNEKKYGVKLFPDRCGSCWKCCEEYIYLADHNLTEYNEPYYIHCLDVLRKADERENGHSFTNIEDLWYGYFSYSIIKSKYKYILKYGRHK